MKRFNNNQPLKGRTLDDLHVSEELHLENVAMELLLLGRGVKLDLGRTEFLLLPGDGELAEPGLVVHGLLDGGLPFGGS